MDSYKPVDGHPHTFLVTTDATTTALQPILLCNYKLKQKLDSSTTGQTYLNNLHDHITTMPLYIAGCCSAAAPTYFKHMTYQGKSFVDGGILANNASALALAQAHELFPKENLNLLLNLGTGDAPFEVSKSYSVLTWGNKCVNLATESVSIFQHACDSVKAKYMSNPQNAPAMIRLSPSIQNPKLDAADESTIKEWRVATQALVKEKAKYIDAIVKRLVGEDKLQNE